MLADFGQHSIITKYGKKSGKKGLNVNKSPTVKINGSNGQSIPTAAHTNRQLRAHLAPSKPKTLAKATSLDSRRTNGSIVQTRIFVSTADIQATVGTTAPLLSTQTV
jgi:hypothetical protein